MFKKSSTIPPRPTFGLSVEQIMEDINLACQKGATDELYLSLDEKVERQQHDLQQFEQFLTGSQELKKCAQDLSKLVAEMEELQNELTSGVKELLSDDKN